MQGLRPGRGEGAAEEIRMGWVADVRGSRGGPFFLHLCFGSDLRDLIPACGISPLELHSSTHLTSPSSLALRIWSGSFNDSGLTLWGLERQSAIIACCGTDKTAPFFSCGRKPRHLLPLAPPTHRNLTAAERSPPHKRNQDLLFG